ncbi:hypothetical protein HYX08_02120 [Candidatus Woesearchaeota archaeon]|nr:hypothetical protein [Candidatus Woesearchaeota archaeon]
MLAFIQKVVFRKLTVILAFSYAIAGLMIFISIFFLFMLGHSVRLEEPNPIIAAAELASAILSAAILLLLLFQALRESKRKAEEPEEQKDFIEERKIPLAAD